MSGSNEKAIFASILCAHIVSQQRKAASRVEEFLMNKVRENFMKIYDEKFCFLTVCSSRKAISSV